VGKEAAIVRDILFPRSFAASPKTRVASNICDSAKVMLSFPHVHDSFLHTLPTGVYCEAEGQHTAVVCLCRCLAGPACKAQEVDADARRQAVDEQRPVVYRIAVTERTGRFDKRS